jgi:glycosyltransferase involved in cell wall biosynthesis
VVEETVLRESSSAHRAGPARTTGRPLRLLVFVSKPAGMSPGQRFRLEQWAPHLATEHGITLDFVPFELPQLTKLLYERGRIAEKAMWTLLAFVRRPVHGARARRYDGAIVFREAALLGPAIYERIMARAGIPFFFDFDDAIWIPQFAASANGAFARLKFLGKTASVCRLSTGVFAGNEFLAAWARQHNERVSVIPTSIDLDTYRLFPPLAEDEPFSVGWSGSQTTLSHYEHARPALERLATRRRVVVKVICNKAPAAPIAGAETIFIPWTEKGEAETLAQVHVGLMPVPDDDFSRGKCGLKALQYMAVGRPVVVSPVGMNRDLIRSGQNGMLATTVDEWVDALDKLATSRDLRTRLAAAGRQTVEQRYSARVVSALVAGAIRAKLS